MKLPIPAVDKRNFWSWGAITLVFIGAAALLRYEGRLWICACGYFRLWSGNICSSDNSQHLLDPYSLTHVLHGFLFFWIVAGLMKKLRPTWQLTVAVALEAMWEVFENTDFVINRYRSETAALGYTGDTIVNSFGDILCCLIGFMIARRLGWRWSIIVFFVLEVIMILWIRDSLLLEIVMLIFSIDTIRAWQMCR